MQKELVALKASYDDFAAQYEREFPRPVSANNKNFAIEIQVWKQSLSVAWNIHYFSNYTKITGINFE